MDFIALLSTFQLCILLFKIKFVVFNVLSHFRISPII
jgi:hypothetical protein